MIWFFHGRIRFLFVSDRVVGMTDRWCDRITVSWSIRCWQVIKNHVGECNMLIFWAKDLIMNNISILIFVRIVTHRFFFPNVFDFQFHIKKVRSERHSRNTRSGLSIVWQWSSNKDREIIFFFSNTLNHKLSITITTFSRVQTIDECIFRRDIMSCLIDTQSTMKRFQLASLRRRLASRTRSDSLV